MRKAIELATFKTKSTVIEKIRRPNALLCIWLRKPGNNWADTFMPDLDTGGAATTIWAVVNEPPLTELIEKLNR